MSDLTEVLADFESLGIEYWLDSGSLLMTCRDGELDLNDSDIDIGIFEEDLDSLNEYTTSLPVKYATQYRYYNGSEYKRKHFPIIGGGKTIDVNIYRKMDDTIWCPTSTMVNESGESSIVSDIVPKRFLNYITHIFARKYPSDVNIDRFPYSKLATIGTWRFPAHLIEPTEYNEEFGGRFPKNWEDYLEYRYGNWKIPIEEWSYWEDDGGIVHKKPEQAIDKLKLN